MIIAETIYVLAGMHYDLQTDAISYRLICNILHSVSMALINKPARCSSLGLLSSSEI